MEIQLGNKVISEASDPFFIAEIGINHNGSLELAKKLIDMATLANVDAVKFQKRTPEICVPESQKNIMRETPWGEMTYLEYRKKVEFNYEQFKEIDNYSRKKNIIWSASVWDIPSVDFLEKFDVPFYKVPSALLTHRKLLLYLQKIGKPVILSTGMSTEEEIIKAENLFKKDYPLIILHCNSSYPAKLEDLNLRYILRLKELFPHRIIGYSGHEVGLAPSLIAAVLGAKVIERHITLDRAMWGSDHAASLEFPGLRRLVRDLKNLSLIMGDGIKKVTDDELKIKQKLRYINDL